MFMEYKLLQIWCEEQEEYENIAAKRRRTRTPSFFLRGPLRPFAANKIIYFECPFFIII